MGEPATAISLFNPFIPIRDERSALKAARLGAVALWAVAIFNFVQAAILALKTGAAEGDGVYEIIIGMIVFTAGVTQWFRPGTWIARVTVVFGLLFLLWYGLVLAGYEQNGPTPVPPALAIDITMAGITLVLGLVSRRGADWLKRATAKP
jgi:hypothetical protein